MKTMSKISHSKMELAQKLYSQLKDIDKEIVTIEKMALACSGQDGHEINFTIEVSEKADKAKKVGTDEDGSLCYDGGVGGVSRLYTRFISLDLGSQRQEKKQPEKNILSQSATGTTALKILSVLINEKIGHRLDVINQLEKIGFSLK